MPYVKVWIHLVWTTKNREPFLTDDIRQQVFTHIRKNAKEKGIYIDQINGYREHAHCLISLGLEQTLSWIVKMLKGESSHWINQNGLTKFKFQWQHEYFAVGVSESVVEKVRAYIRGQEEHHKKQNFDAEFDKMIEKFGFQRCSDDES
ncbi:MAG: IS200/IS605 family transposase [Pyrinomonadaceae bacterium]